MTQEKEFRQLKDYDVLGVGALRRERLLREARAVQLITHPELVSISARAIYDAILADTIKWLKPAQILEEKISKSKEELLARLLLEDFRREFPKTSVYLKTELNATLKKYLAEFPWQGPLLSDHFRYFPGFLRTQFQDSRLYLFAQKEWLWSYLSFTDFGSPKQEAGLVRLNPSLQSLYISEEVAEAELTPGLYIYYYDESREQVCEYKMDALDAAVVDLLHEDRKFSLDQLIDQVLMMDLELQLPREAWEKRLSSLISRGIILISGDAF
jgi:hypothetical protein